LSIEILTPSQSKVSDPNGARIVQQQIAGFDVPVEDSGLMCIVQCAGDVADESTDISEIVFG
jgi:hypothetical protein